MFSEALKSVGQYTQPVIFSQRMFGGDVRSGCGSFVVVNREGWIVTCAHIIKQLDLINQHLTEIDNFEKQRSAIANDGMLNQKQKRKQEARLVRNPEWITHGATMWGWHNCTLVDYQMDELADLAVGKLENFDSAQVAEYPIFKDPASPMLPGTSLCRLGFPFHEIKATFAPDTQMFDLAPGSLPAPRFPNDGIHTRVAVINAADGSRQAKFIETSTPGLRGQSGGPIFDRTGNVWAIQSNTQSLPLGFAPVVKQGTREIVEHQFMHVGRGSHVEEIIKILTHCKVQFSLSK